MMPQSKPSTNGLSLCNSRAVECAKHAVAIILSTEERDLKTQTMVIGFNTMKNVQELLCHN
jgi:hypothetical protein